MTISLILSLIFMVLKLTGNINWSWFIVFLPVIVEFVILPVIVEFVILITYSRSPFWWRNGPKP